MISDSANLVAVAIAMASFAIVLLSRVIAVLVDIVDLAEGECVRLGAQVNLRCCFAISFESRSRYRPQNIGIHRNSTIVHVLRH